MLQDRSSEDLTDEEYDIIGHMPYLDQVLCESLRLFPPVVLFVNREAGEDTQLGKYHIPAGTNVQIPVWQIHHDRNLWPDPYRFDPDRYVKDFLNTNSFDRFLMDCTFFSSLQI